MSIKDILEKQKKPIILGVVAVVLIVVLVVVFAPFGGKDTQGPAKAITKKAKIDATAVAPATQTAKVEQPPAGVTGAKPAAAPTSSDAKPVVAPSASSDVKQAAKEPVAAVKKPATPDVKPAAPAVEAVKKPADEKKPVVVKVPSVPATAPSKVVIAEKKPAEPSLPVAVKTKPMKITKRWAVNAASFAYRDEAEKFAKKLKATGYNAYITVFKKDDIDWHRVRVGFYGTQAEAIKAEKAISEKFKIDTPWAVKPSLREAERHTKQ